MWELFSGQLRQAQHAMWQVPTLLKRQLRSVSLRSWEIRKASGKEITMKKQSERIISMSTVQLISAYNAVSSFRCRNVACFDCPFCTEEGDCYNKLIRTLLEQRKLKVIKWAFQPKPSNQRLMVYTGTLPRKDKWIYASKSLRWFI